LRPCSQAAPFSNVDREHFRGELSHKTQADIARVMQDWITEHGYDAAESTIKLRARKLWQAIKKDAVAEK
jgi:hypothetical protein